ncbi:hydroxyethylthiazole kinase [Microbacterium xanthum]|uniref:hydroxyethylthiazole kinase n=1 Tax=Microbacterium xanthum TaxID=3079794 RepID=UPI002AD4C24A|nr:MULTISPECIES: hydroxyethylthiazole kinase [unclassified Microbacterium]MDZ8172252.1 hydroxyethylthiazole kinase [Microbacterium sp. KSW-48]MDZ8202030.1 hydroxyethylthiazole kinase [Microbacterium sp. SSW1-59]
MTVRTSTSVSALDGDLSAFGGASADLLHHVRASAPLVQCITNAVVTGFTANVLLATGASPAMCDIPDEAGVLAGVAGGLLVNLGTPTAEQRHAALEAVETAAGTETPWVLDPVAVGMLPVRTALAVRLRDASPTIIRGNASEILALAGAGGGGKGVDAIDSTEAAAYVAADLATRTRAVVAVSGPVDLITDGTRTVRVANGHEWLTKVTGGGCALGALMAAFASTTDDALTAAVAATLTHTIAAEDAAAASKGPGSFAVALLDALHALTPGQLAERARLS